MKQEFSLSKILNNVDKEIHMQLSSKSGPC